MTESHGWDDVDPDEPLPIAWYITPAPRGRIGALLIVIRAFFSRG